MNLTCTYCHQIITTVPIIGQTDQQALMEVAKLAVEHTNTIHQKKQSELFTPALAKIAIIEKTLLNLTGLTQFETTDEKFAKYMSEAFEVAARVLEEFRPGKPKPMVV